MRIACIIAGLLIAGPLLAQLDSDSITVVAYRISDVEPARIPFAITAEVPNSTSLDELLAAAKDIGLAASDFRSIFCDELRPPLPTGSPLVRANCTWSFEKSVPLAGVETTARALSSLRAAWARQTPPRDLRFSTGAPDVSGLTAANCSWRDLIADARTKATELAGTAGLQVGPVLALGDPASQSTVRNAVPASIFVAARVFVLPTRPPDLSCSLAVKFSLLRYN